MSIESSNIKQRIVSLEGVVKSSTLALFEDSRERSRASIKGRLFKSSISQPQGKLIVYFVREEDCSIYKKYYLNQSGLSGETGNGCTQNPKTYVM